MGLEVANFLGDLVSSNPTGADGKSAGDDHIRLMKAAIKATFPGLGGRAFRVQSKSSNYSLATTDNLSIIECTAALTLSTAGAIATLGNGFTVIVLNRSAGNIIFDPTGAETINGAVLTTILIPAGSFGIITAGATTWSAMIPQDSRVIGTISGNITLTAAHVNGTYFVGADAVITLPLSTTCFLGDKLNFKNNTIGKSVTFARQGGDTIDGGTTYRLASYETIEFTVTGGSAWNITRRPTAYVNEIRMNGGVLGEGWLSCDFSAQSQATYSGLFAVIGLTWGNPGGGNFNLPDFRARSPMGPGQGLTAEGGGAGTNRVTATLAGAETHSLSAAQTGPVTLNGFRAGAVGVSKGADEGLIAYDNRYGVGPVAVSTTGASQAHNNVHPIVIVPFMIKT